MADLKINGVVLEMDLLDADVMERYEELNNKLVEKIQDKTIYEGKSTSEGMKYQCRCIDKFFDKMFGEGTAEELFGGDNNLGRRIDAYGFVVTKANETSKDQMNGIMGKYGAQRIDKRQQYNNKPNGYYNSNKHKKSKRNYYA